VTGALSNKTIKFRAWQGVKTKQQMQKNQIMAQYRLMTLVMIMAINILV
jgi:hypothetical protein